MNIEQTKLEFLKGCAAAFLLTPIGLKERIDPVGFEHAWFEQWMEAACCVYAKVMDDMMCYGIGVIVTHDKYPYIRAAKLSEIRLDS